MSKTTNSDWVAKSFVIGGLLTAATLLTAAYLRRRTDALESVDKLFDSCEHALTQLGERTHPTAA